MGPLDARVPRYVISLHHNNEQDRKFPQSITQRRRLVIVPRAYVRQKFQENLENSSILTLQNLVVTLHTTRFNIQTFCIPPTQYIYMFNTGEVF
jgi:hypothetical protein